MTHTDLNAFWMPFTANRLVQYTPEGLDYVFFGNSGSEAVETALKIAIQYWAVLGHDRKSRLSGTGLRKFLDDFFG